VRRTGDLDSDYPVDQEEGAMFVRVARFEGIDPDRIDYQVEQMTRQTAAARAGEVPKQGAEQVQELMQTVKRFVYVVDRDKGTGLGISFSETEDDMRRADAIMNDMNPGDGDGRRTGVEIYEVVFDEAN
jgi:hypothetical protein